MPKVFSQYPYNISAAISHKLKIVLDNEAEVSGRPLSEIIREALYEYFDIEEEETVLVRMTPELIHKLQKTGWTPQITEAVAK